MDRRTAIRTLASVSVLPVLAPERATELLDARRVIVALLQALLQFLQICSPELKYLCTPAGVLVVQPN